jgi:amino acid transporter
MHRNDRAPLGLLSATALVVASMIGAGVFTISGYSLAALGSPELVLVAWAAGGVIAVAGAISYGALAQAIRESGGEYVYLARRVHPLVGFLAGWVSLLAGFTGALAFAATALEKYAAPLLGIELPTGLIATAVILLCAAQHAFRVEPGAWLQNVVVVAKLLGLGGLVAAGWWWLGQRDAFPVHNAAVPNAWRLAEQLTWIYLGYSGFNATVYVAEEVRDPERTVPRSMLIGTLLVTAVYLLLNAVFVYAGPIETLAGEGDIAAAAFEQLGGPIAGACCRVMICIALVTSASALTMSGPRVYAKMAADGLFPIPAQPEGQTPRMAIVVQAALAIVASRFTTLQQQLDYLGFILMLSAAVATASLFWVRSDDPRANPRWWQLVAAGLFVVAAVALGALTSLRSPGPRAIAAGVTITTGIVAYVVLQHRSRRRKRAGV